tara:strand:+ start:505 stop:1491 length:987 start_codon:yes stop_codon:yes gene_type:complete
MVGKKTSDVKASCSVLPSIAGISPYQGKTRVDALSKAIRAKRGEDVRGNQAHYMFVGDLLENTILNRAVELFGLKQADLNCDYAVKHKDIPLEGSMDGIADANSHTEILDDRANEVYVMGSDRAVMSGKVVLECKVTRDAPETDPPLWRGVMQLQGLMDCVGAKWGILCVLYQSTTLRFFIYHRDEEMVEEIRKLVLDFDRRVKEEDFYPPENPNDAISIWEKAELDREPIELPEEAEDYVEMLQLANASLKKWEDIKEKSTASLMALLEDNEIGYSWTVKDGERVCTQIKWPTINYKARQERIVPAKEAYSVRQKTIKIKEIRYENN